MLTYLDHFQQNLVNIQIFYFFALQSKKAVNFNLSKENHNILKRTRDTAERGTCGEERKGSPDFRKITEIKLLTGMSKSCRKIIKNPKNCHLNFS